MKKFCSALNSWWHRNWEKSASENTGEILYETTFLPGQWQRSDWNMVKDWQKGGVGQWVQEANGIGNQVPQDATPAELQGKRSSEIYTAMLLKRPFAGELEISCRMKFDYRMAPGLIMSAHPTPDASGNLDLSEHYEIILYDNGLNVWYHKLVDGQHQWQHRCFFQQKHCYEPGKFYDLRFKIEKKSTGWNLGFVRNGAEIGYVDPEMYLGDYFVGLIACEGHNHFENFKVRKLNHN